MSFPVSAMYPMINRYLAEPRELASSLLSRVDIVHMYRGRICRENCKNMAHLEEILQKLLIPDNTVIQQVIQTFLD